MNMICWETSARRELTMAVRCMAWGIGGWLCRVQREGAGEDEQLWERKKNGSSLGCAVSEALGGCVVGFSKEVKRRVGIPGNMESESFLV